MDKNNKKLAPIRFSLKSKVALLITATAVIIGAISVAISYGVYTNSLVERYVELCRSVTQMMRLVIDADEVRWYLASGKKTDAYLATEKQLEGIWESVEDVAYMYVYRIEEDGCHVVFDVDTPELPGGELGDVVEFDPSFVKYLPELLVGDEIEPIISNDQYGWLLSVYAPLYDSDGYSVAYAAADVSMASIMTVNRSFLLRTVLLLVAATALIVSASLWYTQKSIVKPINALTNATERFAYTASLSSANVLPSDEAFRELRINTDDEIENLYAAVSKMVQDVIAYISLLQERGEEIAGKARTIERMQDNIILSFANMIENRDANTGSHVKHTSGYVRAIVTELLREGAFAGELNAARAADLCRSAPLHDIGKVRIPDAILNKPGKLTDEEFSVIKTHAAVGGDILRESLKGIQGPSYLTAATAMTTYHHEKWDGSGYPLGLSGEGIPLAARIMAVADVFDALISRRSYKPPFSLDDAFRIIEAGAGTQFDPDVVRAFLAVRPEIERMLLEE